MCDNDKNIDYTNTFLLFLLMSPAAFAALKKISDILEEYQKFFKQISILYKVKTVVLEVT
jgi:hypothetical protein